MIPVVYLFIAIGYTAIYVDGHVLTATSCNVKALFLMNGINKLTDKVVRWGVKWVHCLMERKLASRIE